MLLLEELSKVTFHSTVVVGNGSARSRARAFV
jgi:hypothetical protein